MKPREVRVSFSVLTDAPLTYLRRLSDRIAPEIREFDGHHFEPQGATHCDVAESSKRRAAKSSADAHAAEAKAKRARTKSISLTAKRKARRAP